jgi:hypothetical protein
MAADIARVDDPVMGCALRLSGEIVAGDADRLRAALAATDPAGADGLPGRWQGNHGFRLCLDSPGGAFPEAIAIARLLHETAFGTAVAAGARCESACALAFMGGSRPGEEGITPPDRVLHPQGRLGFHAPDLIVADGAYTAAEVDRAYAVALQSVSAILDMLAETGIVFPQPLLRAMLATPPDGMLHLERVAQALEWQVLVAPTRFSGLPVLVAMENLCGPWGYAPGVVRFDDVARVEVFDNRADPWAPGQTVAVTVDEGFGAEAVGGCAVALIVDAAAAEHMRRQTMPGGTPAFATYPGDTRLAALPGPDHAADLAVLDGLRGGADAPDGGFGSCWLASATARVVNVTDFVNLRGAPDAAAPVIRQVPRGAILRVLTPQVNHLADDAAGSCRAACLGLEGNPHDVASRRTVGRCIDENRLWYEVDDGRGARGWVSRRFLHEAG